VSLASRGSRKIGEFEEKIENEAELRQVRRQALRVLLKGVLLALPLTIFAYLLPL
jgi:hypothetical protein